MDATTPGASGFVAPTVVTQGPDGKLYVAQQNGKIWALTLDAAYNVTAVTAINSIYNLAAPTGRLVTGMAFGPAGDLFVSHSDGRINDASIDTLSGTITRLTASSGFVSGTPILTSIPRSKHDHAPNGLAFKPGTSKLYLAVGGMTNAGLPGTGFYTEPESPMGAAVLELDVSTGVLTRYATGFRNPYDLLWHSNGNLYLNDNGANAGMGDAPNASCVADPSINVDKPDELNLVTFGQYYGHPNPSRGECVFGGGVAPLFTYGGHTSSDGMMEYTSFKRPDLKGRIVTANWATKQIVTAVPSATPSLNVLWTFTGSTRPIDVTMSKSGGAIFVAEYDFPGTTTSKISVLRVKPAAAVDFNGDGLSDLGVVGPATGMWTRRLTGSGTIVSTGPFGGGSQIPFALDYNGDGVAEFAEWDPAAAVWHVGGYGSFSLGAANDIPLAADMDGDGKTDLVTMNPTTSMWNIRNSATGAVTTMGLFGGGTQVPFLVDVNGSGAFVPATWNPTTATWSVWGCCSFAQGATGDTPLVADIDNDGLTDFITWNSSTGMWSFHSLANGNTTLGPFGGAPQIPFLLDTAGTGSARPAVWDSASGQWHVYGGGVFSVGFAGDVPVRPAF